MMSAYRQRAERDGIVYKQISFDFPIEDNDAIVKAYEQAITPKTKLVHVTHMVNWVGQLMPVRQIADMAHAHGIEVIVDGAHSFGLMDFKIPDLRLRLLRDQPAQVSVSADRLRNDVGQSGQDRKDLAPYLRGEPSQRATFASLRRLERAAFPSNKASEKPSTFTRPSAPAQAGAHLLSEELLGHACTARFQA